MFLITNFGIGQKADPNIRDNIGTDKKLIYNGATFDSKSISNELVRELFGEKSTQIFQ